MGAKKGNTIIISLMLVFVFSSLVGGIFVLNSFFNSQINETTEELKNDRELELKAYDFYINNEINSDLFYIKNDVICYKEDQTIMFDVYIENNIINIRRKKFNG